MRAQYAGAQNFTVEETLKREIAILPGKKSIRANWRKSNIKTLYCWKEHSNLVKKNRKIFKLYQMQAESITGQKYWKISK